MFLFVDRSEAGEQLAVELLDNSLIKGVPKDELLVLSIPRGGVVVGVAIAQALGCPHDVVAVKKFGFPGQKELAIGAMAEDGSPVLNQQMTNLHELEDSYIREEGERIRAKIETYIKKFRQGRKLDLQAKTVILVDDGIATGETMKAAALWLTSQSPAQRPEKVLVAVPVCSMYAAGELKKHADELICLSIPRHFWAVGQFYWDFDQVSDEEVAEYLFKGTTSSSARPSENKGRQEG
jgi:predicted phosphoribosyltransferase